MAQGNTIEEAIRFANDQYPQFDHPILPEPGPNDEVQSEKVPMIHRGDALTRIKFVYLTAAEWQTLPIEVKWSWFYVYDIAQ